MQRCGERAESSYNSEGESSSLPGVYPSVGPGVVVQLGGAGSAGRQKVVLFPINCVDSSRFSVVICSVLPAEWLLMRGVRCVGIVSASEFPSVCLKETTF